MKHRWIALGAVIGLCAGTAPAAAAPPDGVRIVEHGTTWTVSYDTDVCSDLDPTVGDRSNVTTYTLRVHNVHAQSKPDGTWLYLETAVVTYVSDYTDPALPDLTGRLTENIRYQLTPGDTLIGTETFRDFIRGEDVSIKIRAKYHVTEVDGELVVERSALDVVGCA